MQLAGFFSLKFIRAYNWSLKIFVAREYLLAALSATKFGNINDQIWSLIFCHLFFTHAIISDHILVADTLVADDHFSCSEGFFWLRSDSSKVVLILNEYLNIYCIIITLRDSFRPQKSVKKSLRRKTKSF